MKCNILDADSCLVVDMRIPKGEVKGRLHRFFMNQALKANEGEATPEALIERDKWIEFDALLLKDENQLLELSEKFLGQALGVGGV